MISDSVSHNGRVYIETVGCQMNMLDSELVVAALRKDGYELTDNPERRRHRSSSTPAAFASTPNTRSIVHWDG
jgi:hypothetical protein